MKIFHLINGNTTVGAITSIKKIVNQLDKDKFVVGILAYNKPNCLDIDENIEVEFCNLRFNRYLNKFLVNKTLINLFLLPYYFIYDVFLLKRFVKKNNVDIIHTHYLNDNFLASFLPKKVKKVAHIRSIINKNFLWGYGFKYYKHRIYNNSDLIIGISHTVLEAFDLHPNNKVKLVYNGIKHNTSTSINPAFELHKDGSFLIGCVSRFVKDKGLEFLIEIAKRAKERKIKVKFLIIAPLNTQDELEYKEFLLNKINQLSLGDVIYFMGSFPDPSYFMPYFKLLVHPTLQREGFGNVVLEAFMYGVPVLSTDCGGPAEIIDENTNGFIIKDLNYDKFIDNIIYLIDNREIYQNFCEKAQLKALEKAFDIKVTIQLIEKYYSDLLWN